MILQKKEIHNLIDDLPDVVEVDEVIYRLYLRQKLEFAESDINDGNLISHGDVVKETVNWFK
ncbi:hypothetical protein [Candidatus Magnetomonas plexicatena]|uniref:hypothetical protein n=1 Tax=Candidatus Magnetomonas plexicatena TaxID=2552947 RepID=UPI0011006B86|nr:hypothetical protein E2O03_000060 [Nitrospirales bacterium LBB_01]